MARTTPQVVDDRLTNYGGVETIVVGSPAWFAWLEQAQRFAFRSTAGTFTARLEGRAHGGTYWRAYRTIGGRQRRAYLGRSADLTSARLWLVAAQLADARHAQRAQDQFPPGATAPAAAVPILTTKLYVPRPPDRRVVRPHLLARLAAGLRGPLTVIAAPAGFGKTTLLSQALGFEAWEGERPNSQASTADPQHVAWLSLDAGDNDPAVFLRYLIAALQRALTSAVGELALVLLEAPQPPPVSVVLTALINDVAAAQQPLALVLDDYHAIDTPAIHAAVAFLLDHLPPSLHLAIASREDPPLPLARLRGRGQLYELRAADLRFAPGEVETFLNGVMQLNLSPEAIAALGSRTEGWITGLQLAALAMQNHADRDRFVGALSGSNRFIVDYLASEVLDQLPADLRSFLLCTSILSRLCGSLCDALLGTENEKSRIENEGAEPHHSQFSILNSQSVLEYFERANLFLVPLDDERRWYRYHNLFADVLRERLGRSLPATDIAALHRRASTWFEQHELLGEAILHALAARDFERTADIIERIAMPMALDGQYVTLEGWLKQLPADLFATRPYLALARAAVASLASDYGAAEAYLRQADAGVRTMASAQAAVLQSEVAAQRALLASMRGDERSIVLGQLALAQLPVRHPLRGVVVAGLGYAFFYAGDLAAADQLLQAELAARPMQSGQIVVDTSLIALIAMVRRARGQLHEVLRLSEDVLRRATRGDRTMPLASVLLALLLLGLTQCEQNNLDAAEQTLRRCAGLAGEYHVDLYELLARFYLGQVLCARGDLAGALKLVEQAAQSGAQVLSPLNLCEVEGYRALLWLKRGDLASASDWAAGYTQAGSQARPRFTAYDYDRFALAYIAVAEGRLDDAAAATAQLLRDAEATDHGRYVIWALVLQASIFQALGDTALALAALQRALVLAEPEGYVRVFLDAGAPMAALLAQSVERRAQNDSISVYAEHLLSIFADGLKIEKEEVRNSPTVDSQFLIEPLSDRELEVLRLLAEGRNNAEIAQALVVAVSTIKSHVNHIFSKLGVSNRLEAAIQARQLNLL
jgi:LuxR family maltose regulon positive regulatory protein